MRRRGGHLPGGLRARRKIVHLTNLFNGISTTRGDPQPPLLWTARSQRNIVETLKQQGHQTSRKMVSRLLKELGYSLQANRKRLEGAQHPDRNAQFEHINETQRRQLEANEPAISVDAKNLEPNGFHGEWNYSIRSTVVA